MLLLTLLYCLTAAAMNLDNAPESVNVIDLRLPKARSSQLAKANTCSGSIEALRSTMGGIRSRINTERNRLISDFSASAEHARKTRNNFIKAKKSCVAPERL